MCYSVICGVDDCDNFAHCGVGICDEHMPKVEYVPDLFKGKVRRARRVPPSAASEGAE